MSSILQKREFEVLLENHIYNQLVEFSKSTQPVMAVANKLFKTAFKLEIQKYGCDMHTIILSIIQKYSARPFVLRGGEILWLDVDVATDKPVDNSHTLYSPPPATAPAHVTVVTPWD
jgi:hypothetical protein